MESTATKNVYLLNEAFYLPNLQRNRKLRVYLPEGYNETDQRYPVVYMQDGQNLFDEANAFGSEWGIDETLDAEQGKIIIVGIDNGEQYRMEEYMLHDHADHGVGNGGKYIKDVIEVIKPFVDNALRTKPEKEYTAIAGSSVGALISFYAGIYFSDVFGVVGIFSPAFWLDSPQIFNELNEVIQKTKTAREQTNKQRWYFYAGAQETETLVEEVAIMVKLMRSNNLMDVTYQINSGGVHDEAIWKNYFSEFYNWVAGKKVTEHVEAKSDIKIV